MRAPALLMLTVLAAATLAGCLDAADPATVLPAAAAVPLDAAGFVPVQFEGFESFEADLGVDANGHTVHGAVYLPTEPLNATAPSTFPTILLASPYWGGGVAGGALGYMPYDFTVLRMLPRGYAVVFGDLGGNGGSGGCWDLMGPAERASAVALVEGIAAQPWSNGKVGMFGLSYDGMTQVMAASDQAPHLVTVVPASALTSAYKGLMMGGIHYGSGWHQTVSNYEQSSLMGPGLGNADRQPGWLETLQASPECMADNHVGGAPTGAQGPYWQERDYSELGKAVKASVFVTQGFYDPAVKPDNFGTWFHNVPTLKKAWLGYWYHQYPDAQGGGRDDLYLTLNRWFDHELMGIQNGIELEPAIDVQDSQGAWRHETAWPPSDAADTSLYISGDGTLAWDAPTEEGLAFGGPAAAPDGVLGASPIGLGPEVGLGQLTLTSAPLETSLRIAGVPRLAAPFVPDGAGGNIIARLYDDGRLVSQGAQSLLYAADPVNPTPVTPGQAVQVTVSFYPTDYVVPAGHKLSLVLATQDASGWFDPDPSVAGLTVQGGAEATLLLPTVERPADAAFLVSCGSALEDLVKECFLDLEDQGVPADE